MTDEGAKLLRYKIRLLIKHPSIDPALITKKLGLTPHLSWPVGSPRKTPAGAPLAGVHKTSVWGSSFSATGERFFFNDITKMVDTLEPHAAFLAEIIDGNGSVDLIVDLPGDINIGDVLSWRHMKRLSALKINLGIEVFPKFN